MITPRNFAFATNTTADVIIDENPRRKYCLVQNVSDTDVTISLGIPVAAGAGILLIANGGAYEITSLNLFTGRIYGINAVGAKNITVVEW